MITIAICDDEQLFLKKIEYHLIESLNKRNLNWHIDLFLNAKDLLKQQSQNSYDVIFLDIELKTDNGINIAEFLRKNAYQGEFVFISSHINYATLGYTVNAFRYILKDHLTMQLDECVRALNIKLKKQLLIIENKTINIKDIIYLESNNHKLILHLLEDKSLEFYGKLNDIENTQDSPNLLRIHQSYLVNLDYTRAIKAYTMTMHTKISLPIAKARYKKVKESYILWRKL